MITVPFEEHITDHFPLICESTPRVFKTVGACVRILRVAIVIRELEATLSDQDILDILQRCEDVLKEPTFGDKNILLVAFSPWWDQLDARSREEAKRLCDAHFPVRE